MEPPGEHEKESHSPTGDVDTEESTYTLPTLPTLSRTLSPSEVRVVRAGAAKEARYVTAKSIGSDIHATPKLLKIYNLALQKLGDPNETKLRQAFEDVLGSNLAQRGFECLITAPPKIVLLYTINKRPRSLGSTDPRCMEAVFVSYHLAVALDTAQAGTDEEANLQLLAMVILIHELTHWCRRKAQPGSKTPKGQGEAGSGVEVAAFGGEVKFLGPAKKHPQYLISEDYDRSLKLTEVSAVGFLDLNNVLRVPARAAIDRWLQNIIENIPDSDNDWQQMVQSSATGYLEVYSGSEESGQRRSLRLKGKADA